MKWYTGNMVFDTAMAIAFIIVGLTIIASFFMQSPYGRFASKKYLINLDPRLGWFLMELPASVICIIFYIRGPNAKEIVPLIFFIIWIIHYGNRGYIFPLKMRVIKGANRSFSLFIIVIGWIVTSLHGSLHGSFFSTFGKHYTVEWLTDVRFILGIVIYYCGFFFNLHSDSIIRNLRPKKYQNIDATDRYKIPYGGGFRFVTSPQYLAELIAWAGFAIATWSLPGLFILSISTANLLPRAIATHKWYKEKFPDYPEVRRAIIPFIL